MGETIFAGVPVAEVEQSEIRDPTLARLAAAAAVVPTKTRRDMAMAPSPIRKSVPKRNAAIARPGRAHLCHPPANRQHPLPLQMLDFLAKTRQSFGTFMGKMAPMNLDNPRQEKQLFAQCSFAIIRGHGLREDAATEIHRTLRLHGGEAIYDSYYSNSALAQDHKLDLKGLTHIISNTFDFPDYDAACDALIPVIKPSWVDASLARERLANPRQYNPDPRLFLSEVVVCCADIPEGDSDAIKGGVLAMGGLYTSKISTQVTHLVALTMEHEKCHVVQSRGLNIKIVVPHWFDDCLKLGRRIDERPYMLPNAEIMRGLHENPPKAAENGHITGASNPHPSNSPLSTPGPGRKGSDVFRGKTVMLANNLGVGPNLRIILEDLIVNGEGKLTDSIQKADIFVCKYREGNDYKVASRSGKDVGNLAWLYYLITNNVWTSPMRRLLHYPVAREGLPGFKDLRISLSNYSGEARVYLENLVIAAGAECTKTLKQDNTHLITAHVLSEKCAAAKDWGIHLINHLWLEESYAKWRMQSITNTRYTHFPQRTNLGEVVGQTRIDRVALERNFFADDDVEMEDAAESPEPMQPRNQNLPAPAPVERNPAAKSTRPKRSESEKLRTPAASRFAPVGKENITPSTTGSRKSKAAATAKLHELTPDIALYEKERKRVGGVIYGGRRKADEDRVEFGRKRSMEEASDSEATEENEPKRPKRANPPPSMHLLISGYKKWVGHPRIEDSDKAHLRSLGIVCTLDPARASHLAAPGILRTYKFVTALAYAPKIISTDFIDACLEEDELLDAGSFALKDKVNEKKLGVSLEVSHQRATENRNQLLLGRTIYCMENIHGGFDTFKSIVEANGGRCMQYRGRAVNMIPSRRAGNETGATEDDLQSEVYLISGPDQDNARVWTKFRQTAEGARKTARVVKADWLLETAMCQKIQPVSNYELRE